MMSPVGACLLTCPKITNECFLLLLSIGTTIITNLHRNEKQIQVDVVVVIVNRADLSSI
jgi:hypothetical protein